MLATADERAVARALAPAIAQQMRTRSSVGKQQQQQGASGVAAAAATSYAAAGMAARAASTLVAAARDHLRSQIRQLTSLAADIQEDEQAAAADKALAAAAAMQQLGQQGIAGPLSAGAAAAAAAAAGDDDLSPEEEQHMQRQLAEVAPGGGGGQPGTPEQRLAAEVSIAPGAALVWTQGVIRWVCLCRVLSVAVALTGAGQPHVCLLPTAAVMQKLLPFLWVQGN
jgi:hypothetical protein